VILTFFSTSIDCTSGSSGISGSSESSGPSGFSGSSGFSVSSTFSIALGFTSSLISSCALTLIDDIANKFNLEPQDVVLTIEASTQLISIDDGLDDEDDSLAERTQGDFSPDRLINKIVIRDMINTLPAREKRLVIMRYYLDKTQSEVARDLGVSQVQVSRLENKILESFKTMIK
jgi:RNA polymerase sigma factor (sigma-70 family)